MGKICGERIQKKYAAIRATTGIPTIQVACIGEAGERLVANAKVVFIMDHTGGRGCGKVMGDKKLAAIAVHGSGGVFIHDPDQFLQSYRNFRKLLDLEEAIDPFLPGFAFMSVNQPLQVFNENG